MVNHHLAKVYGQAEVGAPPMSVPHIDTRIIDGKRVVLFGPIRHLLDPFPEERFAVGSAGLDEYLKYFANAQRRLDNFDLVKYLISQVMQKDKDRLAALCEYYPEARKEDWRLWQAGQRVQIIKRDAKKGGVLRLAPKWSAMMKAPSRRFSARHRGPPPRRLSCCS